MSEKEINRCINEIKHSMDCEGLPLTEESVVDMEDLLRGKRTFKDIENEILKRNGLLR